MEMEALDAEAATEAAKMLVLGRNSMSLGTPYIAQGVADAINNPHCTRSSADIDSGSSKTV
jgi:hypothetical protein